MTRVSTESPWASFVESRWGFPQLRLGGDKVWLIVSSSDAGDPLGRKRRW